jgi:membrane protein insertase, YidC/Oxa1 family, C-terminal domain
MSLINRLLGTPLGWMMWLITQVISNYGLALLVFTILTRLIMFPLSIRQQKSTVKMQMMQAQVQEIQQKYKNNREKQGIELEKLYSKEGVNPMAGCLPLLIQFPILFGLIDVVYNPLSHIIRMSSQAIETGIQIMTQTYPAWATARGDNMAQLYVISAVKENPAAFSAMGNDFVQRILALDFNFLGMDLTLLPETGMLTGIFSGGFNPVVLIPILSGLTALAMSWNMMKNNPAMQSNPNGGANNLMMMLMTPVMSVWIGFSVPAGVGLYWTFSNVVMLIQNGITNKIYNPKEMMEKARQEEKERKERERVERVEARKRAIESGEVEEKALSQKEQNRRKLAAARKRDAEKYGEEYVDVDDEDLD